MTSGLAAPPPTVAEAGRSAPPAGGRRRRTGGAARPLPVAVVLAMLALAIAGCSSSAPEVPAGPDGTPDPVLVEGRAVFSRRCASCHGAAGGGGRGPALDDGRVVERYPDVAEQVELVHQGRGGMPAFADVLSDAEIDAVVRYTREVLDT